MFARASARPGPGCYKTSIAGWSSMVIDEPAAVHARAEAVVNLIER